MKKIYNVRQTVTIDNGRTFDTSIHWHLKYMEAINPRVIVLQTFDDLMDYVENNNILNSTVYKGIFGKPIVRLFNAGSLGNTYIRPNNFKPVTVTLACEQPHREMPISDLAELLSADDFCEYLRDNGIRG